MQLPPSSRTICLLFFVFSSSTSRDLTRFQITFALLAQGNLVLILVSFVWVRAPSSDPKARKRHCSWSDSSHPVWLSLSATPESFGPWTSERISYLALGIIWAPNPLTADVSFFFFFSRSSTRVQGHAGTTAAAPGRTGSDWRLTKIILIIFVSFIVCYLPTAIIKIVDKEVKRAGKWSHFRQQINVVHSVGTCSSHWKRFFFFIWFPTSEDQSPRDQLRLDLLLGLHQSHYLRDDEPTIQTGVQRRPLLHRLDNGNKTFHQ